MQSFDSRRCHVCQAYSESWFHQIFQFFQCPFRSNPFKTGFCLWVMWFLPLCLFPYSFNMPCGWRWSKIIGHHEKHLGESSNMYDQIRQGSLLEDHDSKWLATFYHPLAYPFVSGSYLAHPGVIYTYTYNVCFYICFRESEMINSNVYYVWIKTRAPKLWWSVLALPKFFRLLTAPFVPGALINSIRQLQSGQYLKDELASSGNPSEMFKCYSMLFQFRAPPKNIQVPPCGIQSQNHPRSAGDQHAGS